MCATASGSRAFESVTPIEAIRDVQLRYSRETSGRKQDRELKTTRGSWNIWEEGGDNWASDGIIVIDNVSRNLLAPPQTFPIQLTPMTAVRERGRFLQGCALPV
jgi:hypothetical protein